MRRSPWYAEAMKVAGIVGWPVDHSRSPAMHNAALRALGIPGFYGLFPVKPGSLQAAVAGLRALGIAGANVTLPHKEAVLPFLDEVDDAARRIGAVNTIVRRGEALVGLNTDAPGLIRSLEDEGVAFQGRALILGAGGAARAAVVGLGNQGMQITVAARRKPAARSLLEQTETEGNVVALGDALALRDAFSKASLLVQATSATLVAEGEDPTSAEAFVRALPIEAFAGHALVDLVYQPRQTALMKAFANEPGLMNVVRVDGLGMLLHQGTLAFEAIFGAPAPVEVMRRALLCP